MARYWLYLNDEVAGPYTVEQMIRTRGFSRQTLVCVDDHSGKPGSWISPADIPELAHIFKAVDEVHDRPVPPSSPKAVPKPAVPKPLHRPAPAAPAAPAALVKRSRAPLGIALLILALLASGGGYLFWQQQKQSQMHDKAAVQSLVEDAPLPSSSLYASLRRFFTAKQIEPRWEFEHLPTGLFNVNASYYTGGDSQPGGAVVYSFEVNLEAQSVRGLNTAAQKLLSEGFPSPTSSPAKAAKPKPAKSLAQKFPEVLSHRVDAFEKGDFGEIWQMFSQHKRSQMIQAGMSESGYVRLQSLTHGLESGIHQTILKSLEDSADHMLVLLRQSQSNHPDIFIKQQWVAEDGQWKLEDEEKKPPPNRLPPGPPPQAHPHHLLRHRHNPRLVARVLLSAQPQSPTSSRCLAYLSKSKMDIDLISPLSIEECQKRLDAALVHYHAQLPFWNRPPRKMIGTREGPDFTLALRYSGQARQKYDILGEHRLGFFLPFSGSLYEEGSGTRIRGDFDTEGAKINMTNWALIWFLFARTSPRVVTKPVCDW